MPGASRLSSLRIIAGDLRRRRVRVPPGDVRPTGDRVRESLFAILGERVVGARVLDLYAGSGALGFEALSRGGADLWAVDSSRRVCTCLEATADDLGVVDRCHVVHASVLPAIRQGRLAGPFGLILADPPYDLDEREELLGAVAASGLLAADGVLVHESEARGASLADGTSGIERFREARYGRARLEFFRVREDDPGTSPPRP